MKAKEFIIVEAKKGRRDTRHNVKPRNPVAKNLNVTASGAGQHKDRKASAKRGEVKHKGQDLGESSTQGEIQRKIDHNKKLLAVARQQGWNSTVKDIESAISKLQTQLKTAPAEMPAEKPQAPVPAGYKYEPYREEEPDGDNVKIFHYIKLPNGKQVDVDFTPYQEMTGRDIDLWIKLGMPERQGTGPLDSEKLEKMASQKGVAESGQAYTTEKQILTRIRQIQYDRKLSGTDSNAGELHRLKQQLKDLRSKQGVAREDISVKGAKFIKPEEGDKVEIKFGFNDYYDRHVSRGEVMRIRPSGDAEVMMDRTAKTELFPLKFLKVLGPRAHVPGPKDPTYGTPANPVLTVKKEGNEMDTPEFQRALASLKKQAAQGPKKTVYDPKTGKYKVVPVNPQGNKNG